MRDLVETGFDVTLNDPLIGAGREMVHLGHRVMSPAVPGGTRRNTEGNPPRNVLLRRMLVESIEICAAWTGKGASGVGVADAAWAEACRLAVAADGL